MANNFSDSQVAISNNSLTDIVTASNKSMVIAGTLSNTGGTSINVTLKKYDASGTADFVLYNTMPLPSGSSLKINKVAIVSKFGSKKSEKAANGIVKKLLKLKSQVYTIAPISVQGAKNNFSSP